jgi:hypothetical protein
MLIFPINSETFKKSFLSGDGQLELQSDQDIWMTLAATGGKFLPTVDRVADVNFKLKNNESFKFGKAGGLKLSVGGGAVHQIQLIWPDEDEKLLKAFGLENILTDDKLCARLFFSANGDVKAEGKIPVGTLSATFGITAGADVAFERLKVYDAETTANNILADLFAGARLPQQIDSVAEIPEPGEVLSTRFGGYLKLRAGMNWGYELQGSRSIEMNQLHLDLDYELRAMAALSVGYSFAGDFRIEARRGGQDGWLRYVVRKNRDSQFNFAADFGFDGNVELKGLPRSADEFLIRLIGADAKSVLGFFHKTRKYASLDELEKKLTPVAKSFVHSWSKELIGKALSDDTLKDFLGAARKVSEEYANLDSRIVDLYQAYLDRIPALRKTLALLAGANDPAALIALTEDEDADDDSLSAWEIIQLSWGTNFYPLLLQNEEFLKFSQFARQARSFVEDDATKPVREFIAKLQEQFHLDAIFEQLGKIKTPEQLKSLADEKLQDIAGRFIGKTFKELKDSELNDAVKTLLSSLDKIEKFKKNWYAKLTEAVNQKFTFNLHYAYTRARHDDQLLDVELDLNHPEGLKLAGAAGVGDFAEVIGSYNSRFVKINRGVFTHDLTTSAHLKINVLGWSEDSLKQLAQNSEHTIEAAAGGLLHVYAIDTAIKQRKQSGGRFKEVVESSFIFRAMGETFQEDGDPSSAVDEKTKQYLIETLRNISVQYDLLEEDERTTPDELTRYLETAEFLGLFTAQVRATYASELSRQFPDGLGKVKVKYVVRYDDRALREAFATVSAKDLRELARMTMRQVISAKYTGMKQTNWLARVGFAYLAPQLHEIFDQEGFTGLRKIKAVTLPTWFTRGAPLEVGLSATDIQLLITLCNIEDSYAKRLVRLQKTLKKSPIPQKELQEASRKFVEMADDLDDWRENAFFAIFDRMMQESTRGRLLRESAMVLEITPPGKKKVTKILMQQQ